MHQDCNRLALRDRWEVLEKLCEGMVALEMVEEGFKGNASSSEDGSSAEDLGVGNDLAEPG